ncbi:WXG100 family type VII secretion target [Gordonia hankookensis]|uniref:ESAT-6-like protein n=1 Tax=Gordonia hankookensis TaxID=589403 RepID=A0ABR7WCV0_9ACTN|nr:WXG100 family type VII secretion target [Gordonia hankookensis]
MSDLEASPEELARTSRLFGASADRLDDRVRELQARVEKFLDSGWEGRAANAFREDWELWLDGARKVVGGLDATASLLGSAGQTYAATEVANTRELSSDHALLNLR